MNLGTELVKMLPNYEPPRPQLTPHQALVINNKGKIKEMILKGMSGAQIARKLGIGTVNVAPLFSESLSPEYLEKLTHNGNRSMGG